MHYPICQYKHSKMIQYQTKTSSISSHLNYKPSRASSAFELDRTEPSRTMLNVKACAETNKIGPFSSILGLISTDNIPTLICLSAEISSTYRKKVFRSKTRILALVCNKCFILLLCCS